MPGHPLARGRATYWVGVHTAHAHSSTCSYERHPEFRRRPKIPAPWLGKGQGPGYARKPLAATTALAPTDPNQRLAFFKIEAQMRESHVLFGYALAGATFCQNPARRAAMRGEISAYNIKRADYCMKDCGGFPCRKYRLQAQKAVRQEMQELEEPPERGQPEGEAGPSHIPEDSESPEEEEAQKEEVQERRPKGKAPIHPPPPIKGALGGGLAKGGKGGKGKSNLTHPPGRGGGGERVTLVMPGMYHAESQADKHPLPPPKPSANDVSRMGKQRRAAQQAARKTKEGAGSRYAPLATAESDPEALDSDDSDEVIEVTARPLPTTTPGRAPMAIEIPSSQRKRTADEASATNEEGQAANEERELEQASKRVIESGIEARALTMTDDDASVLMMPGEKVWIPNKEATGWVRAILEDEQADGSYQIASEDGKERAIVPKGHIRLTSDAPEVAPPQPT